MAGPRFKTWWIESWTAGLWRAGRGNSESVTSVLDQTHDALPSKGLRIVLVVVGGAGVLRPVGVSSGSGAGG